MKYCSLMYISFSRFKHLVDNVTRQVHCLAQGHLNTTHWLFQGSNLRPCIYEMVSLTIQLSIELAPK